MPLGRRSKKVQEKWSRRVNYQIQQRKQQQQQQKKQLKIDENIANILEDFHINPLDYQQISLYESMLKDWNLVITLGRILLVLILLVIVGYFYLLESS